MVSIGGLEQGWKFIPPKCSDVGMGLGGSGVVDLFCYVGNDGTVFMDDGSVEIDENGFGPGGLLSQNVQLLYYRKSGFSIKHPSSLRSSAHRLANPPFYVT